MSTRYCIKCQSRPIHIDYICKACIRLVTKSIDKDPNQTNLTCDNIEINDFNNQIQQMQIAYEAYVSTSDLTISALKADIADKSLIINDLEEKIDTMNELFHQYHDQSEDSIEKKSNELEISHQEITIPIDSGVLEKHLVVQSTCPIVKKRSKSSKPKAKAKAKPKTAKTREI